MNLKEISASFSKLDQIDSTANQLQLIGTKLKWSGLVGSSRALCASAVIQQTPGNHFFILDDKEQAAYFLNDLEGIVKSSVSRTQTDFIKTNIR